MQAGRAWGRRQSGKLLGDCVSADAARSMRTLSHMHALRAGCMAALQAEHFITAHSASADAAASAPAEATPVANGAMANGGPAAAQAAHGGHDATSGAGPGRTALSPAQKAAIDKEADDTPMMAVL